MPKKRVLLMYVHERSGHHQAALAIQKAIEVLDPRAECRLVDSIRYVHPILEKFFRRAYLQLVKKNPGIWEYLYDNPNVFRSTTKLRELIHRSHSKKLEKLFKDFEPTDVVCTQAFPCAVISEFKKTHDLKARHFAVLTDFFPHSYWPSQYVDRYFVPSRESRQKLSQEGIAERLVIISGIPIDYPQISGEDAPVSGIPQILLMGGSQGLGPMEKILRALDRLNEEFEIVVLTGLNRKLFKELHALKDELKKKTRVISYTESIGGYFRSAKILITKPGGLTVAHALAFGTPMIFIEPIPGQEVKNSEFLLSRGAALEAASEEEAASQVALLLRSQAKLESLKKNMAMLAHPDAARQIAREVLSNGPCLTDRQAGAS